MNTFQFLQHINAEMVGGRFKAIIDGVHHFVADLVDGNPILTEAGLAAKEELMAKLPATAQVIEHAAPAIEEVTNLLSDPGALVGAGVAGGPAGIAGGIAEAAVKPVVEKAAVEGVDALLDGLTAAVTKPRAKKAAAQ